MIYEVNNRSELMNFIKNYDIISFDVFDTIIARRVLEPEDVFIITHNKLGKLGEKIDFINNRKRAILENEVANPNIYEIYDKFAQLAEISKDEAHKIAELEMEIEKNVLVRRNSMIDIMEEIKHMGKKVCLITDMYLPASFLTDVLDSLDIKEYDDLFVSCEYRTLKGEELFKRYKDKYDLSFYLHIGDNLYSDIECADKNNIDCIAIKSGLNMFRNSAYAVVEKSVHNIVERNLLGTFISYYFNDPFNKIEDNFGLQDVAACFIGPLIYTMIIDLLYRVKKNKYERVLFASRDGFILKILYDYIKEDDMAEGIYFYTSREAVVSASELNDDGILWLANLPYSFGKKEVLSKVFHISGRDYSDAESFDEYILKFREEIREKERELNQNYKTYINSLMIDGQKVVFVDLVSSGTCHMYLEGIMNRKLNGYYLCKIKTQESRKECLEYDSLYTPVNIEKQGYGLNKVYYLFEMVLTSYEPSVQYFDIAGMPVFNEEHRTSDDLAYLRKIHHNLVDYFKNMVYLCEGVKDVPSLFVDELIQIFLGQISPNNSLRVALVDDWMKTKVTACIVNK